MSVPAQTCYRQWIERGGAVRPLDSTTHAWGWFLGCYASHSGIDWFCSTSQIQVGNLIAFQFNFFVQDGETPVCFRYVVNPLESQVCNIFKCTPGAEDTVRHTTIGSTFAGNMDKLIGNKRASLVWEAGALGDMIRISFLSIPTHNDFQNFTLFGIDHVAPMFGILVRWSSSHRRGALWPSSQRSFWRVLCVCQQTAGAICQPADFNMWPMMSVPTQTPVASRRLAWFLTIIVLIIETLFNT